MSRGWCDATRQPDGSVDWAWITLRLFIAWMFIGAMNTFIEVFASGSYRGADEFFAVIFTSVVVATAGGVFATMLGCILLFPPIGRWWRKSLVPVALLFCAGATLIVCGVKFAQHLRDAATGEQITELHFSYIPGILLVSFCLAFVPLPYPWRADESPVQNE